ncbi:MAG: hypothetical protein PHV34_06100 [Verrucomicrobiae bacterium]|nr:hypothetical protein [Verrucomicrobiae bacterium]
MDIRDIPIRVIRRRMVFGDLEAPTETTMSLGEKVDAFFKLFGSLPLSIRNALLVLMTKGKIQIEYDDGSNERMELQDIKSVVQEFEAVEALNKYATLSIASKHEGNITQRVMVQPIYKRKLPNLGGKK